MKYCVLNANGVELYAGAIMGGNGKEFWPRQIQLPIGLTPLTGRVGSLLAVPEGSVPTGNILPWIMNTSPRFAPPANVGESHGRSYVTRLSLSALTRIGYS